ncbi:MAG: hypothetical protein IJ736_15035, partial [Firmicutes bacterium]|nr:hypothetical protein [Bacillota bacterium]
VHISGGTVTVSGGADCIDSNGSIEISGGTVYSSSPRYGITGPEAVLDADGSITVKENATLIITGSGNQMPFTCEENIIYFYTDSEQASGSKIILSDSDGNTIAEYTATSSFNTVALTSPKLNIGETYIITINGESTEVTISSSETTIGTPSQSQGFGGGRMNR